MIHKINKCLKHNNVNLLEVSARIILPNHLWNVVHSTNQETKKILWRHTKEHVIKYKLKRHSKTRSSSMFYTKQKVCGFCIAISHIKVSYVKAIK